MHMNLKQGQLMNLPVGLDGLEEVGGFHLPLSHEVLHRSSLGHQLHLQQGRVAGSSSRRTSANSWANEAEYWCT